jgi:hypothetical protein
VSAGPGNCPAFGLCVRTKLPRRVRSDLAAPMCSRSGQSRKHARTAPEATLDVDHDLLATTSRARSIASTRIAISGRPGSSRVKFGVGLVTNVDEYLRGMMAALARDFVLVLMYRRPFAGLQGLRDLASDFRCVLASTRRSRQFSGCPLEGFGSMPLAAGVPKGASAYIQRQNCHRCLPARLSDPIE